MRPDQTTLDALRELGTSWAELEGLRLLPFSEATTKLTSLKECVNQRFRKLALELHPDRTGNDPQKASRFVIISKVRDEVQQLTIKPLPPPMPRYTTPAFTGVVIYPTWTAGQRSTSTSATAVVNMGQNFQVRVQTRKV